MLKVFIGWDSREDIAYQVARYSILKRASVPVEVIPIKQHELRQQGLYTRERDSLASTEFTFSRFFVPYLNHYTGPAIFCDCDFLWLCDIKEVFDLFDPKYAVQVVKHNYQPKDSIKMDGQIQHLYPKKNWSSMILWNCEHPSNMILIPGLLNKAAGSTLHQFKWLRDNEIGELSHRFNWLNGWYHEPRDGSPQAVHFTEGGCWFPEYQDIEYADLWKKDYEELTGKAWNG